MKKTIRRGALVLALSGLLGAPFCANAFIEGITGTTFNLTASASFISTPDGGVTYMWMFGEPGTPQYPGPTLIVNQGAAVTINVTNNLGSQPGQMPISLSAPGLNVYCTDCGDGPRGSVAPGDTRAYQFTASRAGTFSYYSDYRTDIGAGMGLQGVIIVRPNNFAHMDDANAPVPTTGATQKAYGSLQTVYDHEYLVFSSDVDVDYSQTVRGVGQQDWETCANIGSPAPCGAGSPNRIRALTEALRNLVQVTPGGRTIKGYFPEYFLINGRAAFDNFQAPNLPWLPTQPYYGIQQVHPGQTALVRFVGAGRVIHPFHPHGNETPILAVDGRLLHAGNGNAVGGNPDVGPAPNLQFREYTVDQIPGQTIDATWRWMPKGLGFDVYGNISDDYAGLTCDPSTFVPFGGGAGTELTGNGDPRCIVDVADQGVPLPTSQPPLSDLSFGGFWSGSPFLGKFGTLPPGEGGLNANGGLAFIWHSHREKELINKDVFPGGLLSIMLVEPYVDPDGNPVEIPRGSAFETAQ